MAGHGLTYTKIASASDASGQLVELWAALAGASPTNGQTTASGWGSARSGCHIMEADVVGADLSGGLAAAFIQTPTGGPGTATSGSVTFSAAANSNNRPIVCYHHVANELTNPDGSWTEDGTSAMDGNYSAPLSGCEWQYVPGSFITASTASWTTSSLWVALGAEIKALVTAVSAPAPVAARLPFIQNLNHYSPI